MLVESIIAGAIRNMCDGLVSGEPRGIRYPGVPSPEDCARSVYRATHLRLDDETEDEDVMIAIWEAVERTVKRVRRRRRR